jgi:hypothetical protein
LPQKIQPSIQTTVRPVFSQSAFPRGHQDR